MPSVGGMYPVRIRMVVVFPAPFGPRNPRISPAFRAKADIVHGGHAAVTFGYVLYFDHKALPSRS